MSGKRVPICANSKHVWRRRGAREVCEKCGIKFPCTSVKCGHLDCAECRAIGLDQWTKENT